MPAQSFGAGTENRMLLRAGLGSGGCGTYRKLLGMAVLHGVLPFPCCLLLLGLLRRLFAACVYVSYGNITQTASF